MCPYKCFRGRLWIELDLELQVAHMDVQTHLPTMVKPDVLANFDPKLPTCSQLDLQFTR